MILPDPNQSTDIPVEVSPESPHLPHPYFRQLTAIISVFVLTAGLGLAVKLAQNRQNPFSKANTVPIERIDLSVKTLEGRSPYPRYGLSATAINSQGNVDEAHYQWGVSSTNSIGNLDIHSSNRYAEFSLNGNEGRADIWIIADGGIKTSYPITWGLQASPTPFPSANTSSEIKDNFDGSLDVSRWNVWKYPSGAPTQSQIKDKVFVHYVPAGLKEYIAAVADTKTIKGDFDVSIELKTSQSSGSSSTVDLVFHDESWKNTLGITLSNLGGVYGFSTLDSKQVVTGIKTGLFSPLTVRLMRNDKTVYSYYKSALGWEPIGNFTGIYSGEGRLALQTSTRTPDYPEVTGTFDNFVAKVNEIAPSPIPGTTPSATPLGTSTPVRTPTPTPKSDMRIYNLDLETPASAPTPRKQSFFGKIVGFILKLFGIKY
ncbi:hypothetical protein HZB69_03245 [Candidatus Amesbacteria bacterium]|nr:hypothetical protein [Candidatus Amesbacteria bacterium]